MVKKAFFSLVVMALSLLTSFSSANDKNATYLYFYGQGCGHCQTVEKYFEKTDIDGELRITIDEDPRQNELKRLFELDE